MSQQVKFLFLTFLLATTAEASLCPTWLRTAWTKLSQPQTRLAVQGAGGVIYDFDLQGTHDRVIRRVRTGFRRYEDHILREGTITRIPVYPTRKGLLVVPSQVRDRITGYPYHYDQFALQESQFTIGFADGVLAVTELPYIFAVENGIANRGGHCMLTTVFFIPQHYRYNSFFLIHPHIEDRDEPRQYVHDPRIHPHEDIDNVLITIVEGDESGFMNPTMLRRELSYLEETEDGWSHGVPPAPAHTWLLRRTAAFPAETPGGIYDFQGTAELVGDFALFPVKRWIIENGVLAGIPRNDPNAVSLFGLEQREPLLHRLAPMAAREKPRPDRDDDWRLEEFRWRPLSD